MYTIRQYAATDRQSCLSIFDSNCPKFFDPAEKKLLERWLDGRDTNTLVYDSSESEKLYVMEVEGKVTACGGFYTLKNEKVAKLTWGMIHRNYHTKGYGKRLLVYRINVIKKEYPGYLIRLDTSQHTYKFFEKYGFAVSGVVNDGYGKDLHRYDMELV